MCWVDRVKHTRCGHVNDVVDRSACTFNAKDRLLPTELCFSPTIEPRDENSHCPSCLAPAGVFVKRCHSSKITITRFDEVMGFRPSSVPVGAPAGVQGLLPQ